ncbi:MAG TPA: helix-turn-helix transcriptional regulator [Bacteroidales bacterium]|nr:helix-turn-helix transcriptional regulator [Bacteroidales bacterium]
MMAKELIVQLEPSLADNVRTFEERQKELEQIDKQEEKRLKRERSSPFSRWSQFNLEHTKDMMMLALKYPKAHAILLFLVDQMDEYNAVVCSYQVLQEVLEIGQATVARSIKVLKDGGFISILKSGTSNIYAINDHVYWKSWGNNRQYSKFPATVVLSLSEQEEALQTKVKAIRHKEVVVEQLPGQLTFDGE